MHKYTQLMKEELATKISEERQDEWDRFAASWATRGFPLPDGSLISGILDIGYKSIEKLITALFEAEKTALSKEKTEPHGEYFNDLAEEFRSISQQEFGIIRSKALEYCQNTRGPIYNNILAAVGYKEASARQSINTKVKILEQELKLGISKTVTHQTIQVRGDVGVINTGQVYGSINARLEGFSGKGINELVEAFSRITQAIKDSNIDEEKKVEQLENIEFLVTEYEVPEQQRRRGVVKNIIQGLEKSLSIAANLTVLWGQYGPTIMKAFGIP